MSDNEIPTDREFDPVEEPAPDQLNIETPEADAVEQHAVVGETYRQTVRPVGAADVDPADAADQQREVDLDDEDYR